MQRVVHVSRKQFILEALREELVAGQWHAGDRLPAIKALAERFGTSIAPVHQALVALQEEGLVVRRAGSGTYVTDRRPVADPVQTAFVINTRDHIFGDFAAIVMERLHRQNVYPVMIDGRCRDVGPMLRSALNQARLMIIQGSLASCADVLRTSRLQGKQLVGVFDWPDDVLPGQVHRVLVDHEAGGRQVATVLWEEGHRHVLLVGTASMVDGQARQPRSAIGKGFVERWSALGGRFALQGSQTPAGGGPPVLAPGPLLAALSGTGAPSAVFGLRDFEAWQVQDILFKQAPERLGSLALIGYGNTPWCRAAQPPFRTMDWDLEGIADAVFRIVDPVLQGQAPPAPGCQYVRPRLLAQGGQDG